MTVEVNFSVVVQWLCSFYAAQLLLGLFGERVGWASLKLPQKTGLWNYIFLLQKLLIIMQKNVEM